LIFKRLTILLLALLVTIEVSFPQSALAQTTVEQSRSKIQALSQNQTQKVELKLRDKTKYKGYITAVGADSFTLREASNNSNQTIRYDEVVEAKKAGGGLSTKTWLILGGVAAGSITTWLIVKPAVCDGGAQTRGIC